MRVALVTCAAHPDLIVDDQPLREQLRIKGAEAVPAVWDDPEVDWSGFDLAVIRTPWDYHERVAQFHEWLDRAEQLVRIKNPPSVVRWNSHKGYLDELQARGVPTVPTHMLRQGASVDLGALLRKLGWGQAVVKPAVSAGARDTVRVPVREADVRQTDLDRLLAQGDVLVQPFVDTLDSEGEHSLVFFGGHFSHGLRKIAVPGDFRVQPTFGGSLKRHNPDKRELDLARSIIDAAEVDVLYARVDLVRMGARLKLIELELIEPLLFFSTDPGGPRRFADAIVRRA